MKHTNILFQQIKHKIPGRFLKTLENKHFSDRSFRKIKMNQLLTFWLYCHIDKVKSLRDGLARLMNKQEMLYHIGMNRNMKLSTLSEANKYRDAAFFEDLFKYLHQDLMKKFRKKFAFPLQILDSSTITSKHEKTNWAEYNSATNGLKIHVLMQGLNDYPLDVKITHGKVADITVAREFEYEKDSILLIDRAYFDIKWWIKLHNQGITFISRLKKTLDYNLISESKVNKGNVLRDLIIQPMGPNSGDFGDRLRLVEIFDENKNEKFFAITNNLYLPPESIAAAYKHRWQIELFFKWLKQNVNIRRFFGYNENAVKIQIWTALITYLLIWQMRYEESNSELSMLDYLRKLRSRLFQRDPNLRFSKWKYLETNQYELFINPAPT